RDAPGLQLSTNAYLWDDKKSAWDAKTELAFVTYWPATTDKNRLGQLEGSGITPRNLKDRWQRLRVEADRRQVRFWLDGLLVAQRDRPAGTKGPVTLHLNAGDQVRNVAVSPLTESLHVPVDLTPFAHEKLTPPIGKDSL